MQKEAMMVTPKTKTFDYLKTMVLPLLMAVYPGFFLYSNNVSMVSYSSLGRTVILYSVLALIISVLSLIAFKRQAMKAANAAFVYLIFFNLYGIVYSFLIAQDWFQVEHYTLLPFFILLAFYTSWLATKVNPTGFWNTALIIVVSLIVFNLFRIIPGAIQKQQMVDQQKLAPSIVSSANADAKYPDIYFIIFDEFAGFDTMRSYWNYKEVDEFVSFVESRGFFVAENSHGSGNNTLHQMVERLNYREYTNLNSNDKDVFAPDIVNNRVMRQLKSWGYSTVTFNELVNQDFIPPMHVDYSFGYETTEEIHLGNLFDPFGILVADNTILRAFSKHYKVLDPVLEKRKNWILFTTEKVGNLSEIPAPRFVYVHFSLPHFPFILDENGKPVDRRFHYNWNYYLGYYIYAINIAERMIDNILLNADPNRPPVIIIQSDHGARNGLAPWDSDAVILSGYPGEYGRHILNLMYIPGYDFSSIPEDVNPINTFPIVFNYLFDTNIPLK